MTQNLFQQKLMQLVCDRYKSCGIEIISSDVTTTECVDTITVFCDVDCVLTASDLCDWEDVDGYIHTLLFINRGCITISTTFSASEVRSFIEDCCDLFSSNN